MVTVDPLTNFFDLEPCFGPNDRTAVTRRKVSNKDKEVNKPRKTSRRERLANEKKQKNWERNMRIYMNTE